MKKKSYRLCLALALIALMVLNACFSPGLLVYANEQAPIMKAATPDEDSITVQRIAYTMLKRAGYQMVSKPSGMRTAVDELLKGDADILPAQVAWLGEKSPELVRIPKSNTTVSFDAYARDNSAWSISSWDDLSGLRVATRWQNLYIEEHLPNNIAMNIKVSDIPELWDALVSGDADVCILANPENAQRIAPKGLRKVATLEIKPVYIYVDQQYADKVPVFVNVLQEMERDGTIDAIKANRLTGQDKVVLHISSYSSDMLWEREMIDGVQEGLDLGGNGRGILYYNFNLNARRAQNMTNQQISLARAIRDAFMERTPDVVIVSDNDALEFVKENYANLFLNLPIVFCGINNFTPEMISGFSDDVAGCTEVLSSSATVQQMLELYPDTKNIYIINDYTSAGDKSRQEIASQIDKIGTGLNILYNDDVSFEKMIDTIESFESDTLLLLGSYFRDVDNRYLTEVDVQKALQKASKMPVFTVFSTGIGEGSFGGLVSSAKKQGLAGGSMAKQILEGKSVSRMPIVYAGESMNEWIFDASIAKHFSIPVKDLPVGSTLVNKKESIWDGNEMQIILIGLVCLLLVVVIANLLFWVRKKRREREGFGLSQTEQKSSGGGAGEDEREKSATQQIENIIRGLPIGFAIVTDDIFTEVNRYCQKEFGLEEGFSVKTLYKNPMIHEKMIRELDMQEFIGGEVVWLNMAGREARRHYMNFGRVENGGKPGYLMFAFDVEELERQKDYSRRSQDDLQKIIDALPSAMAIVATSTCELEYANNEFLQVYGYMTIEEAKGFDFRSIIEHVFAKWQGNTVMFEYDSPFAREHGIHLKMFADQIVFRNKNCIVLIGQDISAETKNADMLMHAAEKEKEANMLKGVFLANMSHEIRTPMNAIIGLAQLALMREQSDENSDLFSKISVSAKNLLSIINDILDFSKIEAEKMDFIVEEFNLEETITNTFLVAAERIEDKKVEILLDMDKDVPSHLCGDKIRLWQILKNLLDNAVKYTQQGRVILKIEVKSQEENQVVLVFQVSDTGMGMTPEQLERLFAPFEQFHRNSTKKAGTGLGLAITKQLIELMGGDIYVESIQDEGTDFCVTLPFAPAENAVAIGEFAKQSVGDSLQHTHTVLLADQDEYARKIIVDILEPAGIKVVFLAEGEEIVEVVHEYEKRGEPIRTVILDYSSEETDRMEMARRLGSNKDITKLLLVTPNEKKKISERELQEAGIKDTIEKPFIISSFLQKVCDVIPEKLQMAKEKRPDFSGARILLCEDNEINQEVALGILESFHIVTVVAENGQEALDILEKEEFDLVLMDISMPVMNGHEATVRIRSSQAPYQNVPIVAMTANVMQDEIDKCLEEGMNEHIEKPIDLVKFQKMLSRFLTAH